MNNQPGRVIPGVERKKSGKNQQEGGARNPLD